MYVYANIIVVYTYSDSLQARVSVKPSTNTWKPSTSHSQLTARLSTLISTETIAKYIQFFPPKCSPTESFILLFSFNILFCCLKYICTDLGKLYNGWKDRWMSEDMMHKEVKHPPYLGELQWVL